MWIWNTENARIVFLVTGSPVPKKKDSKLCDFKHPTVWLSHSGDPRKGINPTKVMLFEHDSRPWESCTRRGDSYERVL